MRNRPVIVDLFGGVGGAAKGYQDAGFYVRSVDINPQPDSIADEFVQADVTELDSSFFADAVMVHAAPPCQRDAAITRGTNKRLRHTYPDLIGPTRKILKATGLPYVIENPAARPDVVLCGETFGLRVIRHRNHELGNWSMKTPAHRVHRGKVIGVRHGVRIREEDGGYYYAVYGNGGYKGTVPQWKAAMGIDWTDVRKSIAEAVPPAYTRCLGAEFMKLLGKD